MNDGKRSFYLVCCELMSNGVYFLVLFLVIYVNLGNLNIFFEIVILFVKWV